MRIKKGIPVYTAKLKYATILLDYDFFIKYQSTNSVDQTDALTKLINAHQNLPEDGCYCSIRETRNRFSTYRYCHFADDPESDSFLFTVAEGDSLPPYKAATGMSELLYYQKSSEYIINSCILFGERVIVPFALQNRVLKQFYFEPQGISRMKYLACNYVN